MIDTKNTGIRISEMAIRGQLSHRVNSSMPIDSIIANIKAERDSLIKKKATKIAKESEMLDDETFDIPQNWKWVALGDVCILLSRGKSPKYSEVKKYPVFAQKCNQPNHLALEKALFLDETTLDKWPEYFRLRESDVVINSTGTGTVGRVGYYTTETLDKQYEFMLPDSHVTVVRTGENVSSRYIYYVLRTGTIQSIMEKTFRGSTNQKEFYIDSVYSIPIPLPPVEEQKEIVEILDKAFEQLNIIDDLQGKYCYDLATLKSKIIDAGIRGKLTEQLPEDGDAETLYAQIQDEKAKLIKEGRIKKEKPLGDITEDEIPFEIPNTWKWVRLQDISDTNIGLTYHPENVVEQGTVVLRSNNIQNGRFDYSDLIKVNCDIRDNQYIEEGDILICSRNGSKNLVGKCAIYDGELGKVSFGAFMAILRTQFNKYLYYYLTDDAFRRYFSNDDTKQINQVTQDILKKAVVPLPPINEQKRITAIIDNVLMLISEKMEV